MTSAASRRALVRAYETHPQSEVPPECADDRCADYEVMDSTGIVKALLDESEKVQEYLDALALARPRNDSDDAELYMKLRGECAELISDGFGEEVDPFILLDGEINAGTVQEFKDAVEAYKLELLDIGDDDTRTLSKTEEELAQAWSGVFMHSLVMRYRIMELAVQDPHALRMLFGAEYMTNPTKQTDLLPDTLKMVAAFDINRGPEKSIILRTHADPSVREYDDQSLLSYYRNRHSGGATLEIRNDIRCMALGVSAAGGRMCERVDALNGLCWMDADNINLNLFTELRAKIELTLEKDRKNAIAACIGWARSRRDTKSFDPTYEPVDQQHASGSLSGVRQGPSKRAAKRMSQPIQSETLVEACEAEAHHFQQWTVRVANGGSYEVDLSQPDSMSLDQLTEELMQTDIVRDYLDKHDNEAGLVRLMREALAIIVEPVGDKARAIERLRTIKSARVDGRDEKAYKLSGVRLPGVGAGRQASKTRILFSADNEGQKRYITIRRILHRNGNGYSGPKDIQRYFS